MPITYTNRMKKVYYLHEGVTKTGKPQFFFSTESEGKLANAIPEGFEIYESPNAQVFLRKIPPKIIADEELAVVKDCINKFAKNQRCIVDIKKNIITILHAENDRHETNIFEKGKTDKNVFRGSKSGVENFEEMILEQIKKELPSLEKLFSAAFTTKMETAKKIQRDTAYYTPVMRFVLKDTKKRLFIAERFCFKGSVDDWIFIGGEDTIKKLVKEFVGHIGQESFFELY